MTRGSIRATDSTQLRQIAECPNPLPEALTTPVLEATEAWASSPLRPRVTRKVGVAWATLLSAWVQDEQLPLLIRRPREGRGALLQHVSGKSLVPTDNSPANWSLSLALAGICPSLGDVRDAFEKDAIPIAMALRREERDRARYRCLRAKGAELNGLGWKVAHIRDVGLGYRAPLRDTQVAILTDHFHRFLSPTNMFVVPLMWAGLAEIPEMLAAIARFDEISEPLTME